MAVLWNRLNRKIHHWGSIIIALPLLLILCTGMLLLVKKQVPWIQPETRRGQSESPSLEFSRVLDIARTVPEAKINSWEDIDRLDVRPSRGSSRLKARTTGRFRSTTLAARSSRPHSAGRTSSRVSTTVRFFTTRRSRGCF